MYFYDFIQTAKFTIPTPLQPTTGSRLVRSTIWLFATKLAIQWLHSLLYHPPPSPHIINFQQLIVSSYPLVLEQFL